MPQGGAGLESGLVIVDAQLLERILEGMRDDRRVLERVSDPTRGASSMVVP